MHIKKLSKGTNFSLYILAAAVALVVVLTFGVAAPAFAEAGASDAFEVVFPTENYFQSEQPTLVAANEGYLIVYDDAQSRLYVRGEDLSTYFYDISSILALPSAGGADEDAPARKSVYGVYAVGTHAVIIVGTAPHFETYSLDLKDMSAAPEKKELTSPEQMDCFASDGNKLYAKNTAGHIAAYDESMQINEPERDIYNYDVTPGQANFAASDGVIYIFTTDAKNTAQLYKYDSKNDEILLKTPSRFVQSAFIGGDVIYAQISPAEEIENHSKIICLDKETGEELYTSNFMPESFCAYGDKLYSIERGNVTGYRLKKPTEEGGEYALEPEEILSMTGGDLKHLDNPSDLLLSSGAVVVADSDNMRLAYITPSAASLIPYPLDSKPLRLASDADKVYALLESGDIASFEISDDELIQSTTIPAPENDAPQFSDIVCYDSYLYAVDGASLYMCIGDAFYPLSDLDGAKRIAVAKDSRCFYALTDSEIVMLDQKGNRLPARLTGDFSSARDIAVDYAGNVCVLYADRAEYFENAISSLKKTATYEFSSTQYAATATSCALAGDELYFSAEESFVGKLNVDAVSDEGYTPPALPALSDETYRFAKLKDGISSYFIPAADGRADSVIPATSNVLLVLDKVAPAEGLAYAMDSDKLYIIPTADFEAVTPTSLGDKAYKLKEDGALYRLPYLDEGSVALAKGAQGVRAASDCAGYDGNRWLIVSYDGKTYFALAELLEEDLAPPVDPQQPEHPEQPEETKAVYGRAKAARVGGTVDIYTDMSETSVLTPIVDGKKVEILATYAGYYQVRYGDVVGFMRASEVKIGGLTTVQIVAIVLSVLVLIAGTGISVSIFAIKKRSDPEK